MKRIAYMFFLMILFQSCLEEVDWVDDYYQKEMVIEAVLTDEDKFQEITLSYTAELNAEAIAYVKGASVVLIGQDGSSFVFSEAEGRYLSEISFAVKSGVNYHLEIELENGTVFNSDQIMLSPSFELKGVSKQYIADERGEGIGIFADIEAENVDYFRYEIDGYREIKAPGYSGRELKFNPDNPFEVSVELARDHQRTCYIEEKYTQISFFETEGRSQIENEQISFFSSSDPVIAYGYGAYLKVYSLSPKTFEYYSALKSMALDSDVFNQVQLGNLYSSVRSLEGDERMLGIFELASVRKQAFVARYSDFQYEFEAQRNKAYVNACEFTAPRHIYVGPGGDLRLGELYFLFLDGVVSFVMENGTGAESFGQSLTGSNVYSGGEGPYLVVSPVNCADCTKVGDSEKPEFWVEFENKNEKSND